MKEICKPKENIAKLWGEGKLALTRPSAEGTGVPTYRLFTYVIETEADGGRLLLNTVTGEVVFLDVEEVARLDSPITRDASGSLVDELIRKHFLVSEESDDKKTVDGLRKLCRALYIDRAKNINKYLILPTTACNARCFYCYEGEHCDAKAESMSDETADKLVDFIDKNRSEEGDNSSGKIHIKWYGGEPLLATTKIDYIADGLKKRGINFESTLITNGYLLGEELASRIATDWNVNLVQITLDGTEEVYNKTKNYKSATSSPYKKVLSNIESLQRHRVPVVIRLNLGLHNADNLIELARELDNHFIDKTGLGSYIIKLYEDNGSKRFRYDDEQMTLLVEKEREINRCLQSFKDKSSFTNPKYGDNMPTLKYYHCRADRNDSVVITPSGNISVCEQNLDDRFIGSLDEGIDGGTEECGMSCGRSSFKEHIMLYPYCAGCKIYPTCVHLKNCRIFNHCHKAEVESEIELYKSKCKACYEEEILKQ